MQFVAGFLSPSIVAEKPLHYQLSNNFLILAPVKKFAAILLLAILLFNFAGYRLLFYCMQQKQSAALTAQLDNNDYVNAELVTITVPLSLPYQTDWKDFERADGEIQLHGKTYHYIKRKIENGNLILQCIADEGKMQVQSAKQQYADANALQNSNPSSQKQNDANTNLIKLLTSDCIENPANGSLHICINNNACNSKCLSPVLLHGFKTLPVKPPEA